MKPKWYQLRKDPVREADSYYPFLVKKKNYWFFWSFPSHKAGYIIYLFGWRYHQRVGNDRSGNFEQSFERADRTLQSTADTHHHVKDDHRNQTFMLLLTQSILHVRYQSIGAQAPPTTIYQELLELGNTCQQSTQLCDELGLLGQGVVREIRILQHLFRARQAIVDYAFQDSCIALFTCKQDLNDWKKVCQDQNFAEVCRHSQK